MRNVFGGAIRSYLYHWDLTMRRSTSLAVRTASWERYPFLGELSENADRVLLG